MKKTLFIRNAKKVNNKSETPNLLFIRNTTTAETRKDVLDGRNYLVVPCVMIVEGVHNGSQGSLFYSEAELSKFVCCWNMKPVLLRHPDTEDSGTDVAVLRNQGVGILLNTEFTDGKLKTEVWIDEEKANKLDSRIVSRIENDEKIEVSTGLFTELDLNAGVWNGESFESNTLNYRPDHLAILLDSTGACSIDDGAGLLQNKELKTRNELNHSQIHEQLNNLVREKNTTDSWTWVMDVYDKYFIYEQKDDFFRQDYLVSSDDVVTLSGEAVEVKREVKYKPVTNNKESKMLTREELVAKLIANTAFHFTDAKGLEGFSDELLGQMVANSEPKEDVAPVENNIHDAEADKKRKKKELDDAEKEKKNVKNAEVAGSQVVAESVKNNSVSLESFLASAPKEIAEVLNSSLAVMNSKKNSAIEKILANTANTFSKEALELKSMEEVEMIAKIAENSAPVATVKDGVDVDNAEVPVLGLPTLYAGQPDESTVTNEDVPTLGTIPLFTTKEK